VTVVVDVGNTYVKWARLRDGGLADIGTARLTSDAPLASLREQCGAALERIVAANVAGASVDAALGELARDTGAALTLVTPATEQYGVRCAYADPSRLGADRWVGVVAAHRLIRGPVCVIDAGTTVTLDAVAATGEHLGGLILAGPGIIAAALDRSTRGIGPTARARQAATGLSLLGRDTDTAVAHGAMLGIAAALDRAIAAITAACDQRPTVVLTGGGADALVPWLETEVSFRPHFILEGLAQIAALT
jgi:type III pantothenate kinase